MTESLNENNPHPAYLCGRLMSLLEQAQKRAIPGIKRTIVNSFFATASSAPASVFPRLLRLAQNHLNTLQRDQPGTFYRLQERIEGVISLMPPEFPRIFTLQEQGTFMIGYYHQRAADRAAAREAAQRKQSNESEGENERHLP